jgi:hypothetical protein
LTGASPVLSPGLVPPLGPGRCRPCRKAFLPPADYPFVPTANAAEYVALRTILRLSQREGAWTAVLLDGSCQELEPDVAQALLNAPPLDRAYLPATLFERVPAFGETL